MLAVLEGWRQDGTLPVNGVDIELVSQSFDALDGETKLAACQKFGTEDEIFAVLGGRIFTEGAECLATRFQIPVIDTDQATGGDDGGGRAVHVHAQARRPTRS